MTTFVMVAGMGCGSWTWQPVARLLAEQGHEAVPLTMPGLGFGSRDVDASLQDAVQHVVDRVRALGDGPVTLVGHSWGGIPMTGAAVALGRDRVGEVVYHGAVVPQRGTSMVDENPQYGALMRAALESRPTFPLDLPSVAAAMMQDEPEVVQQLVYSLMVDTPGRYLTDEPDFPPVTEAGIAARYLLGDADQALARPGAEFAARLGLVPETVPGSHLALFSHPQPIADAIAGPSMQPS